MNGPSAVRNRLPLYPQQPTFRGPRWTSGFDPKETLKQGTDTSQAQCPSLSRLARQQRSYPGSLQSVLANIPVADHGIVVVGAAFGAGAYEHFDNGFAATTHRVVQWPGALRVLLIYVGAAPDE